MARRTYRTREAVPEAPANPARIERGQRWPVSTGSKPYGNPPIALPDELPDPDKVDAATGQPVEPPASKPDD